MNQPDFAEAIQYAYQRLSSELPHNLYYHNSAHTFDDVLTAALRFATHMGIQEQELELIKIAAAFHDIGFIQQREGHEQISIKVVNDRLPKFGFSAAQIETICSMIQATQLPQTPQTVLDCILADADLDVLGRDDFFTSNEALRREFNEYEQPISEEVWYAQQLQFLLAHTYFTKAANELRYAGKQKNIAALQQRLKAFQSNISE